MGLFRRGESRSGFDVTEVLSDLNVVSEAKMVFPGGYQIPTDIAKTERPIFNVKHFGACGDGTTDDTFEVQDAFGQATSAGGGVVFFPPGRYVLSSNIETACPNVVAKGVGGTGQYRLVGMGLTQLLVASGKVGLTFNTSASSTVFQGPKVEGLTFVDNSGNNTATGGLLIKRTNNWRVEDCSFTGFGGGYGFHSDGTGNLNQYPWLVDSGFYDNLIGFKATLTGGIRIVNPVVDANSNTVSGVRASSTGIQFISGGTNFISGAIVQGCDIGVDYQWVNANNLGNQIIGLRGEACNTLVKLVSVKDSYFLGIQSNNSAMGGGGTALSMDNACTGNVAMIATQSTSTPYSKGSGTGNTVWVNGYLDGPALMLEQGSAPPNPAQNDRCQTYMKGDLYVISFNHSGTMKYRTLDLSSTNATWSYTTVAP